MSLSGALFNAFSGLTANARAAAVVSTNISNATTEGYGRRSLDLSANSTGGYGGVRVDGVQRHVDPVVLADRRLSDAQLGQGGALLNHANTLESLVGESGAPGSLTVALAEFETALISAASNPAAVQRLETVAYKADGLADKLNAISNGIQKSREQADQSIATQVETLNRTLERVQVINRDLVRSAGGNQDMGALLDERQKLVDAIAEIVPLRVVERDRGEIAIFTTGGAALLDGQVRTIGFTQTSTIEAGMTHSSGALSGLTLAGYDVSTDQKGLFRGGSLAAQFEIRDERAVETQANLDAIARDLAERFGPGGPDATLIAGDPGLFTDAGIAFDPVNEVGLSARISLNDLVAPGSGEVWRLRDGLAATSQGPVGEARLLKAYTTALSDSRLPASGSLPAMAQNVADHLSTFASSIAGDRVRFEDDQTYFVAQNTALTELELAGGVNTDQELQSLLEIEKSYAANAKVMSVVDDLIKRLLNI